MLNSICYFSAQARDWLPFLGLSIPQIRFDHIRTAIHPSQQSGCTVQTLRHHGLHRRTGVPYMNTPDQTRTAAAWPVAPQVPRHEFGGDYATISPEAWLWSAADDEDVLAAMFGQIAHL